MARRPPDLPVLRQSNLDAVLAPKTGSLPYEGTWGRAFEESLPERFTSPAFAPIWGPREPLPTNVASLQNRATINDSGQELPAAPATMEELYAPKGQPVIDPWYDEVQSPDQVSQGEEIELPNMEPVSGEAGYVTPVGTTPVWQVPFSGGRTNSRSFGGPRSPGEHAGVDIPAPIGSPVHTTDNGTVVGRWTSPSGYGNIVDVEYPDGTVHRFAHLGDNMPVAVGTKVPAGTVVGYAGVSGNANSRFQHVHYEVINSDYYNAGTAVKDKAGNVIGHRVYGRSTEGRQDPRLYTMGFRGPNGLVEFQQAAKDAGIYTGEIDGRNGPLTQLAIVNGGQLARQPNAVTQTAPAAIARSPANPEDVKVALVALAEARGEGYEGLLAVTNVINNRMKDQTPKWARWGNTVDSVLGGKEFAPPLTQDQVSPEQWEMATNIAAGVRQGFLEDNTNGALFFYNPDRANPNLVRDINTDTGGLNRTQIAGMIYEGQGTYEDPKDAAQTAVASGITDPGVKVAATVPPPTAAAAVAPPAPVPLPTAPAMTFAELPPETAAGNVIQAATAPTPTPTPTPPEPTTGTGVHGLKPGDSIVFPDGSTWNLFTYEGNGNTMVMGTSPDGWVQPIDDDWVTSVVDRGARIVRYTGPLVTEHPDPNRPHVTKTAPAPTAKTAAFAPITEARTKDDTTYPSAWRESVVQSVAGPAFAPVRPMPPSSSDSPFPESNRDVYKANYGTEKRETDAALADLKAFAPINGRDPLTGARTPAFAPVPKPPAPVSTSVVAAKPPAATAAFAPVSMQGRNPLTGALEIVVGGGAEPAGAGYSLTPPGGQYPSSWPSYSDKGPGKEGYVPGGFSYFDPWQAPPEPDEPTSILTTKPPVPAGLNVGTPIQDPMVRNTVPASAPPVVTDVSPGGSKGGLFSRLFGNNSPFARSIAGIGGPQVFTPGGPSGVFPGGYKYQTGTGIQNERSTQFTTPSGRTYTYTDQSTWGQPSIGGWSK